MSQGLCKISNTYTYTQQYTKKFQRAQAEAEANARELWLNMQRYQSSSRKEDKDYAIAG